MVREDARAVDAFGSTPCWHTTHAGVFATALTSSLALATGVAFVAHALARQALAPLLCGAKVYKDLLSKV